MDAFLLKITIEERLGWPVELVSDGLLSGVESALNLSGPATVYEALASGEAHIYPEVRRPAIFKRALDGAAAGMLGSRADDSDGHGSLHSSVRTCMCVRPSQIIANCRCGSRKRRAITDCMFNVTKRCTPFAPFVLCARNMQRSSHLVILLQSIAPSFVCNSFLGGLFRPTRRSGKDRVVLPRGRRGPLERTRGVSRLERPGSLAVL